MRRNVIIGVAIILLIASTQAAPSEIKKDKDPKEDEPSNLESKDNPDPVLDEIKNSQNQTETQRQKRWYEYGLPMMTPTIYPAIQSQRDELPGTGFLGVPNPYPPGYEEPYSVIFRKLKEIASAVNPPPPPISGPSIFPVYFPVIYVPPSGCRCNNAQKGPNRRKPSRPENPSGNKEPAPGIANRFPDMEDTRQNWGFVIDEDNNNLREDADDDFSRPLSFDPIPPNSDSNNNLSGNNRPANEDNFVRPISFSPIRPNVTLSRPPPPVEHGSTQAGSSASSENVPSSPQSTTTTVQPNTNVPSSQQPSDSLTPNSCDSAVLSCCLRSQVTFDCFNSYGCPEAVAYENPCESNVILRVIDRFQRFYAIRTG